MATKFNINEAHVRYVRTLAKQFDLVIIHGDGTIFHSNDDEIQDFIDENGKRIQIPVAQKGSNHHKVYNSGFDDFEATSIAKYSATYHKGENLPKTPQDIVDAFFRQAESNLRDNMEMHIGKNTGVFKVEDEPTEAELKSKAKADAKAEKAAAEEAEAAEQKAKEETEKEEADRIAAEEAAKGTDAGGTNEVPKNKGGRPKNK